MITITRISQDDFQEIPAPRSKNANFFSRSFQLEQRAWMRWKAARLSHDLFVAKDRGYPLSIGLTQDDQVISVRQNELLLSRSHARHEIHPDAEVPAFSVGKTYTFYIDPASNVILGAKKAQEPTEALGPPRDSFLINLDDLLPLDTATAMRYFSRLRRQPHIPFQYPANGCWARAHEMCRLIEHHLDPDLHRDVVAKVWNFQIMFVETDNAPLCRVPWWYHVAPVVKVGREPIVLDPALCDEPVPVKVWQNRQSQTHLEPYFTNRFAYDAIDLGSRDFFRELPGATRVDLEIHRLKLILQIYKHGPLPYPCLPLSCP